MKSFVRPSIFSVALIIIVVHQGILRAAKQSSSFSLVYVASFSMERQKRKGHSLFFTHEITAPPLKVIGMNARNIDHTFFCQPLPITYTNDPQTVKEWLQRHTRITDENPQEGTRLQFLGFDTEAVRNSWSKTVPKALERVATVQLATPSHALVVQLAKRSLRPSRACDTIVKQVVHSSNILKVGCALDQDFANLYHYFEGQLRQAPNRLDLSGIFAGKNRIGLRTLTELVLGLDLPKPIKLTTSNWARVPLTVPQVQYAARDAWAAAAILDRLAQMYPNDFDMLMLQQRFQSQPSLDYIVRLLEKRRNAKRLIKYIQKELLPQGLVEHDQAAGTVQVLNQILRDNPHPEPFPVSTPLHIHNQTESFDRL